MKRIFAATIALATSLVSATEALAITADGCRESVIGSVRLVVDKLRAAGYVAKLNAKCVR